jgi:putative MATE family efflux protein
MTAPPPEGAEVDELDDPEAAPAIPSASLAARAGAAALARPHPGADPSSYGEIWSLAWPVMGSQVLAYLVNLIDVAMVGRLSRDALAAVGYATQVFFLAQSVFFAIGFSCVALMARAIGARDLERARRSLAASLVLSVSVALGLTALTVGGTRPILQLLGAEPRIAELSVPYFRLLLGSSMLLAVSAVLESAFRAVKDTRTPMAIGVGVTGVKTVGNALLIFGWLGFPRLELVGAGLATVISGMTAVLLFVVVIARRSAGSALAVRPHHFRGLGALLRTATRIALPAVGERVVMNLAMLSYFRVLSGYGSVAVAVYTVGVRVLAFSWIPGTGFAAAASTLVGQSLGARDPRGATRVGWHAAHLALAFSLVLGLVCAVAREPLGRLFTADASVIAGLAPFMLILAVAQPFLGLHFTLAGALRGAGETVTPLKAAALGNWGFRVPLAVFANQALDLDLVWIWSALLFDHLSRAIWLTAAFRGGRWRR